MYYLGLDIGGTKCAVSLGKIRGGMPEVEKRKEAVTKNDPCNTLEELSVLAREWVVKYHVKYAGISCGGPLNAKAGVILAPPNLSKEWHGFDIVSYVKSRLGVKAFLENDANASAVAEWKFGAGKGTSNMVFMTFGTGLGAGLILNGKLYSGTNGNAGEIGHLRLENDGPVGYGKAGSAEGFCSGGGILRLAKLRAKEQKKLLAHDLTTKDVFEMARQGDVFFVSIVKESAEKFARVLSLLIDLFNPEVIAVGGVFMRNHDLFMPVITPVIEQESLPDASKACRIVPAKLGEKIGDYAALALAVTEGENESNNKKDI